MELRHLRYFLAIVQEKSFTTAAEKLGISQPALSKQIKDLEDEIGRPLFVRSIRNIRLTEAGQFLRQRAMEIVDLSNKTMNELAFNDAEISGEINLASCEVAEYSYIAKAVKKMKKLCPMVRFNLTTGDEMTVRSKLDKGLVDFGVFVRLGMYPDYESISIPMKSAVGVMTWKSSSLAKKEVVCPGDLLNEPLIVSKQSLANNVLSPWLGFGMDELNIAVTSDMLNNVTTLVKEEIGSAIVWDGVVNLKGTNLKFVPFASEVPMNIAVAWKRGHALTKACARFIELLKEDFKR